jgi:integrase
LSASIPTARGDQRCFTYPSVREARAERAKIISDRSQGSLVKLAKTTLAEPIDSWLASKTRGLKPSTARSYADSLALASTRIDHIKVQDLTRNHIEKLVSELLESGRGVGNVQRQGLGRSANLMLPRCRRSG